MTSGNNDGRSTRRTASAVALATLALALPACDAMDPERAFAVETGQGIAAISLDSLDSEEHKSMLPAYELAKNSLTLTTG